MSTAIEALHALAAYKTHGGYTWAALMDDGELLCVHCVRANYRQIFRATQASDHSGWRAEGITHDGESEQTEHCAHCNRVIWEREPC